MAFTDSDFQQLYWANPHFRKLMLSWGEQVSKQLNVECPALASFSRLVATFFDNGPATGPASRGTPKLQYKLAFEGWTGNGPITQPDWRVNVGLRSAGDQARLTMSQIGSGTISEEYGKEILKLAQEQPSYWFGQFASTAGGKRLLDHQFCVVEIMDGEPAQMMIVNGGEELICSPSDNPWSKTYQNTTPLASPIKAQLRWDITQTYSATHPTWATLKGA